MQTIRDQYLTARKKHTCSACGCVIKKGAFYHRQTVTDGEIYDWLSHRECDEAISLLGMFDDVPNGEGITDEGFRENINGYLRGNGIPCEGMNMFQKVKTAIAHAKMQNKNTFLQTQLQYITC